MSAEALPQQPKVQWPGFEYAPVRGLMNKHIARYLRFQRKNMRRFFNERGFPMLAMRLDTIKKDSAMSMLEKNRHFQEILNAYAKLVAPPGAAAVPAPGTEAIDLEGKESADVVLQPGTSGDATSGAADDSGSWEDDVGSVPVVEE